MNVNRRVLLVDADVDHRAQVKQNLAGLPYEVVAEAHYGVEATRLAKELQPDVVFIHVEEAVALALRTLEHVQQAAPRATPVVISKRNDADTARKAMLAGARAYLVSPMSPDTLDEVLSAACERQERLHGASVASGTPDEDGEVAVTVEPARTGGYVLTVFGPKGGVGKTTIATNLALALRQHTSARVVLVDVDAYFGDVAVMMGLEPDRTLLDLLREFYEKQEVQVDTYLTEHSSGLQLLAARHSAELGRAPDPDSIAQLLKLLAGWFDFVVVDTPGHFGPQVAAALDESTTALLITSAEISSIKDARICLDTLRKAGFDNDRVKVVVNHSTRGNAVSSSDIARTIGYDVFWDIPHDGAVPASIQHGSPVMLSAPGTKAARQVDGLASYFSGVGPSHARSAAGGGWLQQARGRRFWQSSN